MSDNEFSYKPRKTRIARINKGDKVIIDCIAEDLQDEFERMLDLSEIVTSIEEDFNTRNTTPSLEDMKDYMTKAIERDLTRIKFWEHVCHRYNAWYMDLAIKDGYALVRSDDGLQKMFRLFRGQI